MEERTRAYLRGRFRDYYRRETITPPPDADSREWGFIPWTESPGTTMVRHRSLLDLGDLGDFLQRKRPRHVYFSAGRYEYPGASTMDDKEWLDSDLIFDLDADHLSEVTLGEDSYAEMLAKCKQALFRLLDFLERDFGFEDLTIVFSGGRGYHVHVRDESVRKLEREHRREIVDYVQGVGHDENSIVNTEAVAGIGLKNPTKKRMLKRTGGWGRRGHEHLLQFVDELLELEEEQALERLQSLDGVGKKKARGALNAARTNYEQIRETGNLDVHQAFYQVGKKVAMEPLQKLPPGVDEPVTTDTNRLIRLPGSLHGGSGLAVRRIDYDDLAAFDPLVDAVPETFVGQEISIEVADETTVQLYDETFTVTQGEHRVPEYAAIFMMARGMAQKGKE